MKDGKWASWNREQVAVRGNPNQERLMKLETELEQSWDEITHLTERLEDIPRLEQQLSEALQQVEQLRQGLQA